MDLKVKYHNPKLEPLCFIGNKSDWVDLRCAEEEVIMKAGEHRIISLGVSIKLPGGYEAIMAPRSSTFKNFGIIQTNSIGIFDESYCGTDDIWRFSAYALRDTKISLNDRIAQFRIIRHQPDITFTTVDTLSDINRGGIGSYR